MLTQHVCGGAQWWTGRIEANPHDERAWGALGEFLFQCACRVWPQDVAQETAQQICTDTLARLRRGEPLVPWPACCHPEAYFAKAIRNHRIDQWRHRRCERRALQEYARRRQAYLAAAAQAQAQRTTVEHLLAQVSPHAADLLRRRFYDDMTSTQIAQAYGVADSTVRGWWPAIKQECLEVRAKVV